MGCNRGTFIVPSNLQVCARASPTSPLPESSSEIESLETAVACLKVAGKDNLWVATHWSDPLAEPEIEEDVEVPWPQRLAVRRMFLLKLNGGSMKLLHQPTTSALRPLSDCILAIIWELLDYNSSRPASDNERIMDNFARLLPATAIYQAKLEKVMERPCY